MKTTSFFNLEWDEYLVDVHGTASYDESNGVYYLEDYHYEVKNADGTPVSEEPDLSDFWREFVVGLNSHQQKIKEAYFSS